MTDRARRKGSAGKQLPAISASPPAAASRPVAPQAWEPWLALLKRGFPILGIAIAIAAGAGFGLATALLVLAATALLAAITTLWTSLQWIAGDAVETADDLVPLTMPGAEFEQKHAVLRALKDLEYERSVGKISEQDYEDLRERYRAKARTVLQNLDRELEPTRADAEKLLAAFLKSKGIHPAQPTPGPAAAHDELESHPSPARSKHNDAPAPSDPRPRRCPSCSTSNDADAAFCKKCGRRLEEPPRAEAGAEP